MSDTDLAISIAWKASKRVLRVALWIFAPEALGRQLAALAVVICVRRLFYRLRGSYRKILRKFLSVVSKKARQIDDVRRSRRKCRNYRRFMEIGEELDNLQGKDKWKKEAKSPYYDAELLQRRTENYQQMRESGDVEGCLFSLRGECLRKHFGTLNPALFDVTNTGTKEVIENYVQEVCDSMSWLAFSHRHESGVCAEGPLSISEKLTFFSEIVQSFGRTALVLSGGASLGVYHFGVVKALHLNGLLPRVLAGTSAGSIICGAIGTRTDDELLAMWEDDFEWMREFNLDFFSGPDFGRYFRKGGSELYSTEHLGKALRQNIGEMTFLEAYDRTGRICNITVSGMPGNTRYPMLLNYLTSPHVLIWSASVASCSLPGVFEPQELLEKDRYGRITPYVAPGLKWLDGSMQSDLPLGRLSELFGVNFFIVSQVNPQARMLTGGGLGSSGGPVYRVAQFLRRQVKQYLLSFSQFSLGTAGGRSDPWLYPVVPAIGLVVQEYEGDITIYNGGGFAAIHKVLTNPDEATLKTYTRDAEFETWWMLPQIQNACAIEFVMDEIIKSLRAELVGPEVSTVVPSKACSLLNLLALDDDEGDVSSRSNHATTQRELGGLRSRRHSRADLGGSSGTLSGLARGNRRSVTSGSASMPLGDFGGLRRPDSMHAPVGHSGGLAGGRLIASHQSLVSLLAAQGDGTESSPH